MGMAFQLSPGVVVREYDLTNIIPQVATSGAALVGAFTWGPVDKIKILSTEEELVESYGIPDDNTFVHWFCAKNFLDYSRNLKAVRCISEDPATGSLNSDAEGAGLLIKNVNDWQDFFSNGEADYAVNGAFAGKYPGLLGNSLAVHMADRDVYSALIDAEIVSAGAGYTTADDHGVAVTFTNPTDQAGVPAEGTLEVVADVVTGITLTEQGSGYRTPPDAIIPGPSDVTANGTLEVVADVVVGATITDPGFGYDGTELVTLPDPDGGGTTATATITVVGGEVTAIVIVDVGVGYTTADDHGVDVVFAAPATGGVGATGKGNMWEYYNQFLTNPNTSDYVAERNGENDEMHIVVVDEDGLFSGEKGRVLERFAFASKAKDAKFDDGTSAYYAYVLRDRSNYIWMLNHPEDDIDSVADSNWGGLAGTQNIIFDSMLNVSYDTLSGARDGNEGVSNNELIPAWDKHFSNADTVDIGMLIAGDADQVLMDHLIQNIAEFRKDCVACISPRLTDVVYQDTNEVENIMILRNVLPSSSYGVMDCNWKYQFDAYNDTFRWIPCNGDIAGLMARVDNDRDPWWSPAGFNRGHIKNAVKLAWNPTYSERDEIYPNGINPVVTLDGEGTLLYGDRTMLIKPSAFDRINVRRLFIVLEKAIAKAAKYQLFEFNDEFTRLRFVQMVEPYLRDVQGRRGIYDFKVVCDETNNTPFVIDSNAFIGDIYIKPARSINFITLNFIATSTGVVFEEIIGKFG